MGVNTRTYKFALGTALLGQARAGRTDLTLSELATPYALALVEHLDQAPQASTTLSLGEDDFLAVASTEAEESKKHHQPTEALLDAAIRSMPTMVMQKFHNLRGGVEVPHRFYEVTGRGNSRTVILTSELQKVAASEQANLLGSELEARWAMVETSFAAGVGRSLVHHGVAVDRSTMKITDVRRRRVVTGVIEAVIGFQHGRCLICKDIIDINQGVAIDHVFPFSFMNRGGIGGWIGRPDLDSIWNLAPAHPACNGAKSNRPPTQSEIFHLAKRNRAIMTSQKPLSKTLELTLKAAGYSGVNSNDWYGFLNDILLHF